MDTITLAFSRSPQPSDGDREGSTDERSKYMNYASTLVISRHRDLWLLSDGQGVVCVADSRGVLDDCRNYCKIHRVKAIDEIKKRFSNILLFLR